jgi:hypothetical protein
MADANRGSCQAARDSQTFHHGGFALPKDLKRSDYRASWARMVQLLGKMHKAGVPIVSGTDGSAPDSVRPRLSGCWNIMAIKRKLI